MDIKDYSENNFDKILGFLEKSLIFDFKSNRLRLQSKDLDLLVQVLIFFNLPLSSLKSQQKINRSTSKGQPLQEISLSFLPLVNSLNTKSHLITSVSKNNSTPLTFSKFKDKFKVHQEDLLSQIELRIKNYPYLKPSSEIESLVLILVFLAENYQLPSTGKNLQKLFFFVHQNQSRDFLFSFLREVNSIRELRQDFLSGFPYSLSLAQFSGFLEKKGSLSILKIKKKLRLVFKISFDKELDSSYSEYNESKLADSFLKHFFSKLEIKENKGFLFQTLIQKKSTQKNLNLELQADFPLSWKEFSSKDQMEVKKFFLHSESFDKRFSDLESTPKSGFLGILFFLKTQTQFSNRFQQSEGSSHKFFKVLDRNPASNSEVFDFFSEAFRAMNKSLPITVWVGEPKSTLSYFLKISSPSTAKSKLVDDWIFKSYPVSFDKDSLDGKDLNFISILSNSSFDFDGKALQNEIFGGFNSQKFKYKLRGKRSFERKSSFIAGNPDSLQEGKSKKKSR